MTSTLTIRAGRLNARHLWTEITVVLPGGDTLSGALESVQQTDEGTIVVVTSNSLEGGIVEQNLDHNAIVRVEGNSPVNVKPNPVPRSWAEFEAGE